jgi:hypothetical protein
MHSSVQQYYCRPRGTNGQRAQCRSNMSYASTSSREVSTSLHPEKGKMQNVTDSSIELLKAGAIFSSVVY